MVTHDPDVAFLRIRIDLRRFECFNKVEYFRPIFLLRNFDRSEEVGNFVIFQTGQGQVVDACMSDGAALMMVLQYGLHAAGIWNDDKRGGNVLNGGAAYYQCYETQDGGYVALGPIEPQFFRALLETVGCADDPVFSDQYAPAAQAKMQATLKGIFATRSRDAWRDILEQVDACCAPVLSMAEAPSHPHNLARGTFVQTEDVLQPGPVQIGRAHV